MTTVWGILYSNFYLELMLNGWVRSDDDQWARFGGDGPDDRIMKPLVLFD
jgi:hypothetical protein